jgi:hypothetical protein
MGYMTGRSSQKAAGRVFDSGGPSQTKFGFFTSRSYGHVDLV